MGILTDDMQRVVLEQRLGLAATVSPDGTPNLSPKGTTVLEDEHLLFADIASPQTARNLQTTPAIEINVVDPLVRKGYRFKGTATVHTEGEVLERALALYVSLGLSDYRDRIRGVVLVKVEQALPLTSPIYDLGFTEEEVRKQYAAHFRRLIDDVAALG